MRLHGHDGRRRLIDFVIRSAPNVGQDQRGHDEHGLTARELDDDERHLQSRPPNGVVAAVLHHLPMSALVACNAGASPNTMVVAKANSIAKRNVVGSG